MQGSIVNQLLSSAKKRTGPKSNYSVQSASSLKPHSFAMVCNSAFKMNLLRDLENSELGAPIQETPSKFEGTDRTEKK